VLCSYVVTQGINTRFCSFCQFVTFAWNYAEFYWIHMQLCNFAWYWMCLLKCIQSTCFEYLLIYVTQSNVILFMYSMAIYSVKLVLYLYLPVTTLVLRSIMAFSLTLQTSLLIPQKIWISLKIFLNIQIPFIHWMITLMLIKGNM
jgi:hypothetical protein